jgi:hypothetical protein
MGEMESGSKGTSAGRVTRHVKREGLEGNVRVIEEEGKQMTEKGARG